MLDMIDAGGAVIRTARTLRREGGKTDTDEQP
jgi:hypothetical protein